MPGWLQARFPLLLFVESFEEQRMLDEIEAAVAGLKTPRTLWRWTATEGLRRAGGPLEVEIRARAAILQAVSRVQERAVFVLGDLHAFLSEAPSWQIRRPCACCGMWCGIFVLGSSPAP